VTKCVKIAAIAHEAVKTLKKRREEGEFCRKTFTEARQEDMLCFKSSVLNEKEDKKLLRSAAT
jgi:hypothetical protein